MRMSSTQLSFRTPVVLAVTSAVVLLAILADSARAELPVSVSAEQATQAVAETVASVPAEVPPVATPEPAPAPAPEAAPTPIETTSAAVEEQVTKVVTAVTGGGATAQVKAVAEGATATATAQVKSVTDAANVRPAVEGVMGSVPNVKRLPGEVTPAVRPDAPSHGAPSNALSDAGSARQNVAEGKREALLPGPAPQSDPAPSRTLERTAPLETRPVAGWITGLNLRQLFVDPVAPHPQAQGSPLGPSSIDPPGAAGGAHVVAPDEAPHPSPPHGPGPSPDLSPGPAPGPGSGSFFVPIAALLALLALTSPAISRRWKGALVIPVPPRFVCALERPG